jgi:hypothetical protein
MRRLLFALLFASLVALPTQHAYADDQPDPCQGYAAQAAMPALLQSYQYSPQGYGPWGYAPLTYPFGAGPFGNAALFGVPVPVPPPGGMLPLTPSFGPLGPGVTSNLFATRVLAPSGFSPTNPANIGNVIPLLGLQQAELAQLNTRYSNGAYYQTAAATYMYGYATEAASAFARAMAECKNQQPTPETSAPNPAVAAAEAAEGVPPAAPSSR